MKIKISDLMEQSGVKFGTSGARGLASDMTDKICYIYTVGFLQYLREEGKLKDRMHVAIAGDFRPSTDRIMYAVKCAVEDMNCIPVNCGKVPSPCVALYGIEKKIPAIMVTGSHIPEDRNGIKFNKIEGEILKDDEAKIKNQVVEVDDSLFDVKGNFVKNNNKDNKDTFRPTGEAEILYKQRYVSCFGQSCLKGKKIGVYKHSAVGREILQDVFEKLGAEVTPLGFSDTFIPVDTEAVRQEDVELARRWSEEYKFDAIISTDGDSDRPLIADEYGRWLRGDVAGILCAKYLEADSVSLPVSCNTAVEKCGFFKDVRRTRIGSPYVIAAMNQAVGEGFSRVVGYEANGGFLTGTDMELKSGNTLKALPTRDAIILLISILMLSIKENKSLSALQQSLPPRYTASDRLKNFPRERSMKILNSFSIDDESKNIERIEEIFGNLCGKVYSIDRTDGIRITFQNNEIIHLRPSGNAPEFRCYNEASTPDRVKQLNCACMKILKSLG